MTMDQGVARGHSAIIRVNKNAQMYNVQNEYIYNCKLFITETFSEANQSNRTKTNRYSAFILSRIKVESIIHVWRERQQFCNPLHFKC